MALQAEKIRLDFEVLKKKIIYFDNACMSLRPKQVVDKINEYYNEYPACAGRSGHKLSKQLEHEVVLARKKVADFIRAKKPAEIVFTRNTTESVNLVANSIGLKKGDSVLISDKEHNSNLVPWLVLKNRIGINLKFFKFGNIDDFEKNIKGVKLVSCVHTSNVDGTSQDIRKTAGIAHKNNARIMVDAAQSAPHKEIDARKLDADFIAFSGHKMCGPSGTGILYGKMKELEKLSPFMTGGDTVKSTTYSSVEWEDIPHKFEAGLQHYAGIVGLGTAVSYLKKIGLKSIEKHEIMLNEIITEGLKNDVELIGPENAAERGGIFSFNIKRMDPHEIAGILDHSANIMIRAGMHCVHSWFNANKLKGSARASLYFYNTEKEAERFVEEMKKIVKLAK